MFSLLFTDEAKRQLQDLIDDAAKAAELKKVRKTLGLLQTDPRHPSLNTHKYSSVGCSLAPIYLPSFLTAVRCGDKAIIETDPHRSLQYYWLTLGSEK